MRKNIGNDFALRGFVCYANCGVPLRSSWSTGKTRRYAYYLCQTKSCASYGKSIARDKIEGEIGALIKSLQPTKQLLTLAKAMLETLGNRPYHPAPDSAQTGLRRAHSI